ncbi:MAG: thioether cross-link-forming SCIFF peptide maturase [Oscillospiraceae bacterium]|nr:thioether cross-link-forming SCIFF peptide maturase [Oscillospiraceae bacterium]MDD4545725.1 thioether cross-link-forming SCIFF peptide maturase [Oscillospiraceae bacterium]
MIHRYKNNGYNIVLDVNSGAVHIVDDPVYELLGLLGDNCEKIEDECPADILGKLAGEYGENEVCGMYDEVVALHKADQLYSSDDYAQFADKMVSSPLKAMCLHVSHDCNLRCKYCFAGQGVYGGDKKIMSLEVAKAAIDFLIEKSQGRRNLEMDFFGGEPLMNMEVIKSTVEYGRSLEKKHGKVFRFTATTNGMLLDNETSEFLNREMNNVVLSLDGRREVNDAMRPNVGGRGSYHTIVPKYQHFVNIRGERDYYVRGTFTKNNLDFSKDVLHMTELGFNQVSVEPVVSDPELPFSIKENDLPRVFEEYDLLAKLIIERRKAGKGFNFFHFMIDLDQGPCAIKRMRGCGCGNEYAAVDPDGDIYPCHQFVGQPEWKMGSVLSGEYDLDMKQRFAHATVYDKEDCRKCWAKFYCSGGCNANNQQYEGDILRPHTLSCKLEKKRLECAIMIKVALSE